MAAELNELKKQLEMQRQQIAMDQQRINEEKAKLAEEQRLMKETRQIEGNPFQNFNVQSGTIGSLNEFNMKDDWTMWSERFEHYVFINNVDEVKRKSLFLTLIGPQAYALLRNLCTPDLPANKSIYELHAIMKGHLQPAPSIITERYIFKECKQLENQSVKEYLATLKKFSWNCDFGENLESHLRDQFVWGLHSAAMKKRLLGEHNLTYQRAIELATALESATKDVVQMSGEKVSAATNVNKFNQKTTSYNQHRSSRECYCCGRSNHVTSQCRYKSYKCNKCHRQGHLGNMCRSRNFNNRNYNSKENNDRNVKGKNYNNKDVNKSSQKQNFIQELELDVSDDLQKLFYFDEYCYNVSNDEGDKSEAIFLKVKVEEEEIKFELDTGSPISAISVKTYNESTNLKNVQIMETKRCFKSYQGDVMKPVGVLKVNVNCNGEMFKLDLFVFKGKSEPIIGRSWVNILKLIDVKELNDTKQKVNCIQDKKKAVKSIVEEFKEVFSDRLGKYTKRKFNLELKGNVKPVFCKPRPLPYALKSKVEDEIERLVKDDILTPVDDSDWATPIVPIIKNNGQVRICGDYKITLNPSLKKNRYPIPRIQDLFSTLRDGKYFSKIDLSRAYQQVELGEESKKLVVITTSKGLFAYNRLCFGVSPAPGLFQGEIEKIMKGIKGVISFFDDILISGPTRETHDDRLRQVLTKLKECGLTAQKEKCDLFQEEIKFLGYVLSKEGVQVSKERTEAILKIESPRNQTELRAFLGIINYYSKFIKNYSLVVGPLYNLLKKNIPWSWSKRYEEVFQKAKQHLISHDVLMHYDPSLPVKLTCDASPFGVGAVLTHILKDEVERPIAYASRTLSVHEKNYSQIDREALAIIFAVKYFHQYIYGREFILETDHKPLIYIFGSKKGIPQMAASRLQRWAVVLLGYDYTIKYIKGVDNKTADYLSRFTQKVESGKLCNELNKESDGYSYLNYIMDDIVTLDNYIVKMETEKDAELSRVLEYVRNGWPKVVDDVLIPYKNREKELSLESGCIMWGYRIVIPKNLQQQILKELHHVHMGIVRMKAMARSYVWWVGIDRDIEGISKSCKLCLENSENPPKANLHVWQWPEKPNERLHMDFLGPIDSHMYMVIIDAFSKWVDIRQMRDISSKSTIAVLKDYFATWGLPVKLVSDNGPAFISKEFSEFVEKYGIKHIKTAPYHPASNGAAENAVRTFKNKFKILLKEGYSKQEALSKYLFYYRASPHITTGVSPAELQTGRVFRTILDLVRPTLRNEVQRKQEAQQRNFRGNRSIEFKVDDKVMVKNYSSSSWELATITRQLSSVTYLVTTNNEAVWKRHIDQMRPCNQNIKDKLNTETVMSELVRNSASSILEPEETTVEIEKKDRDDNVENKIITYENVPDQIKEKTVNNNNHNNNSNKQITLRRSSRTVRPPQKLNL